MIGELLDVFSEAIGKAYLDGFHEPGMEQAAALGRQSRIDRLVGQRVLERVLEVGEQACLLEELGGLKAPKPGAHHLLRGLRNGEKKEHGYVVADNRSSLEEALVLGRQALDAGVQDGLHRGRDLQVLNGTGESITTPIEDECACLDQRADTLLQEERVASCALNERGLECCRDLVAPH